MVDLETLSTDSNAVILTIGAVPFGGDGKLILSDDLYFYERVNLPSYNKYTNGEFACDWNTLLWWLRQDKEPLNDAFLDGPRYPIWTVMKDFVNWLDIICKTVGEHKINIWSHGKDFDVVVIQNALKVCGIECPWMYWDTRDTRTLYALAGIDSRNIPMPEGFKAHNAVGDCLKQIEGIRLSYNVINNHVSNNNSNNHNNNQEVRRSKRLKNADNEDNKNNNETYNKKHMYYCKI